MRSDDRRVLASGRRSVGETAGQIRMAISRSSRKCSLPPGYQPPSNTTKASNRASAHEDPPTILKDFSSQSNPFKMPPIRSTRNKKKPPPDGFDDIEETLLEFEARMKDAESASHEGKKRYEVMWPIFQIIHERSRYIYDQYYEAEGISKQLYDWLLKNGYADANLIAKWKKQGYEKLCCLKCIEAQQTNFGATCICRVPKKSLKDGGEVECVNCGCHGCASSD
jgi:bud site selection protein 31